MGRTSAISLMDPTPNGLQKPAELYVAKRLANVRRVQNCHRLDVAFSALGWNADQYFRQRQCQRGANPQL